MINLLELKLIIVVITLKALTFYMVRIKGTMAVAAEKRLGLKLLQASKGALLTTTE
jgi:hypothetical protein